MPAKPDKLYAPYQNEALDKVYNLLFCDNPDLFLPDGAATEYPWDILFSENPPEDDLKKVAADKTVESRMRLLAFGQLRTLGVEVEKQLLGVVIEVGMPEGLDTLAAYDDGTARYLNHAGKLVIWETRTAESNQLIQELFNASVTVVSQIGPWDQPRKPFPGDGQLRLSFLVSDGLYFGEGLFTVLQNDPMGGPVIQSAIKLLQFLTSQEAPA